MNGRYPHQRGNLETLVLLALTFGVPLAIIYLCSR